MENIKYLKKIVVPEIEKYNFKSKRVQEVNNFVFMNGRNHDIKFRTGQILTGSPSLEELFSIVYSMLYSDIDFKYHSAIVNADSITLIGYRCWDSYTNNYFDPSIDINDFGICLTNEDVSNFIDICGENAKSRQQTVDRINQAIQYFIRRNITKNDEQNYLIDLETYIDTVTNLV